MSYFDDYLYSKFKFALNVYNSINNIIFKYRYLDVEPPNPTSGFSMENSFSLHAREINKLYLLLIILIYIEYTKEFELKQEKLWIIIVGQTYNIYFTKYIYKMSTSRLDRLKTLNKSDQRNSTHQFQTIDKLKYETKQLIVMNKLKVQQAIKENKFILEKLNKEINKKLENNSLELKNKIIDRISNIKNKQKQRERMVTESNRQINKIKLVRKYYQEGLNKKVNEIQFQKKERQLRALSQKKQLRIPIDFKEIKNHELKLQQLKEIHQEQRQIEKFNYTPPKIFTKAGEYTKQQYKENKIKQVKKINMLKQMIQKRYEYGDEAYKKYKNIKPKTLDIKQKRSYAENSQKNVKRQQKKLKYKFIEGDIEDLTSKEIQKIKKSKLNYFQKFEILNNLSKVSLQKYCNGKQYGINLATQANLALADLYLQQS